MLVVGGALREGRHIVIIVQSQNPPPATVRPPVERATAWRRLRAMRSTPPRLAGQDRQRRQVFSMALEQAEQLFRAATTVDYASRPLLLYYGLNQATRALSAATMADQNRWPFTGHGLKVDRLDGITSVPALPVRDNSSGSSAFEVLTDVLGSASLPGWTPLNALWVSLPDLRLQPLTPADAAPRALEITSGTVTNAQYTATLTGLPASLADTSPSELDGTLADYLEPYPTLAGHVAVETEGLRQPVLVASEPPFSKVTRGWPRQVNDAVDLNAFMDQRAITYGRSSVRWVMPAVGGNTRPLHPYATWFAILYTLSMVARYAPAQWGTALDVNQSSDAVRLEEAMDTALDMAPNLVLQALMD